ncbi:UNVERIFIED_CONTAM: hypothetical protein PYX00_008176 [Menopon gallinae]|uniref:Uncharacterized protein n=1 Tax=Menopon gallinae TaxID=328185 RepID=A0AAW2HN86_9NEOP
MNLRDRRFFAAVRDHEIPESGSLLVQQKRKCDKKAKAEVLVADPALLHIDHVEEFEPTSVGPCKPYFTRAEGSSYGSNMEPETLEILAGEDMGPRSLRDKSRTCSNMFSIY